MRRKNKKDHFGEKVKKNEIEVQGHVWFKNLDFMNNRQTNKKTKIFLFITNFIFISNFSNRAKYINKLKNKKKNQE